MVISGLFLGASYPDYCNYLDLWEISSGLGELPFLAQSLRLIAAHMWLLDIRLCEFFYLKIIVIYTSAER